MSNPTTPFSWQMPTNTDLVTDLPADFEVFGQAVATSLADLLGGTTGQVLAKASNTNMDFAWVAQDDSNAIQNAIMDAKGDLIGATAADTPARLAVGSDGQILTADSTAATGIKWATPATGTTFSGCLAYFTYNAPYTVTVSADTAQTIQWDNEAFDTDNYHSTSTNKSRFTIPSGKSGYYQLYGSAWMVKSSNSGAYGLYFKKNGGNFSPNIFAQGETGTFAQNQITASTTVYLAAADYVEMQLYTTSVNANMDYQGSYFGIQYLGA